MCTDNYVVNKSYMFMLLIPAAYTIAIISICIASIPTWIAILLGILIIKDGLSAWMRFAIRSTSDTVIGLQQLDSKHWLVQTKKINKIMYLVPQKIYCVPYFCVLHFLNKCETIKTIVPRDSVSEIQYRNLVYSLQIIKISN